MIAWWEEFSKRTLVAHMLRAVDRFNIRGGAQLAAAIAYHSVLSMVPILMLAFSALALTLTVLMPEALQSITRWIEEALTEALGPVAADPGTAAEPGVTESAQNLTAQILAIIEAALRAWRTGPTRALARDHRMMRRAASLPSRRRPPGGRCIRFAGSVVSSW